MDNTASAEVANFLSKLNGVKKTGSNWAARCPCRNDDSNPSLSIGEGQDGRVLVTCHRGNACSVDEICKVMNIEKTELFPPKNNKLEKKRVEVTAESGGKLTLVATYNYRDRDGTLLFQKQRFVDEDGKKTFRQRRPTSSGEWSYKLGETPRVLYNLPAVANAVTHNETVWIVEGEKDADTLTEMGYVATTMPNGAGTWNELHTQAVAGGSCVIVADNDNPGIEHAAEVRDSLESAGCSVTLTRPPAKYKDVSDMIADNVEITELLDFDSQSKLDWGNEQEEAPKDKSLDELIRGVESVLRKDAVSVEQRLSRASLLINTFSNPEAKIEIPRLVVWEDFLDEEDDDSYDWVIPGLLERQERVIVVAAEGVGKTMLARQIAICASAGIHPFTMSRMDPITTLTIDLENPERIIRRTSRSIMHAAKKLGHVDKVNARLLMRPAGLDLLKQSDRSIVEKAIEETKPDLLVMGPLYKSFVDPGGRTSEAIAIEVAKYLDSLRDYYGCAMWLEHHAPLGTSIGSRDLRPFGSAVWSRWPEFGISLTPDPTATDGYVYNVGHFRGARDMRQFPTKMKRGKVFPFEVLEFMKVD
jgi:hypothetical protein